MTNKVRILSTLFILMLTTSAHSQSQGVTGVWSTEKSGQGYLNISIFECENKLCGTIVGAYSSENQSDNSYEHLGKLMVWGMKSKTPSQWTGGKIWDPSGGKTYKSKMTLTESDVLSVSGCVLLFCKSQDWTRVKTL